MDQTPNGGQLDPGVPADAAQLEAQAPAVPTPIGPSTSAPFATPPVAPTIGGPTAMPIPAPVPPAQVKGRRSSSSGTLGTAALVIAGVLAVGGIAFAAGRLTAPAAAATSGRFGNGQFGQGNGPFGNGPNASGAPGFAGRGDFGPSIEGTVESVDASSITLKLANGQTATIKTDGSTTYSQQTAASSSDVTAGSTVIVRVGFAGGQPNASPGTGGQPAPSTGTSGLLTDGTARSVTVVK